MIFLNLIFINIFFIFFPLFNQLKMEIESIIVRSLFYIIDIVVLFIFFIKDKRQENFEIYWEQKKLIKYIHLTLKYERTLFNTLKNNKFIMKGIVKYRFSTW